VQIDVLEDKMPRSTADCTQVTPECPLSATTLGYAPNLGANLFFTIAYGLCALVTIAIAVWKRTWAFGFTAGSGFILEMIGSSLSTWYLRLLI
jgi:hypothetical protein